MSTAKYIELVDKENTNAGLPLPKHSKGDEAQIKKTVLGETNQPKILANEPTSPEDSKLLERKRQMNKQSVKDFSFKLNFC
jgi:hypothetical protein